ncbi:tumor necrosis factor receptor superfamily member 6B-like [Gouania willdenowi]|uniref:Tumor necrosis factor receptor superfamily member 6B-like n=1 Tax=Gouania willdenowi TaxID=441366 RepID=A0A8C5ESV6_GOUWI|nr:tumor necrosis factor receptor superfamily member 6B-like [Gouania willdenowi]
MGMLSSLLLLILSVHHWEASAVAPNLTFYYQDPLTGQTLNCTKCPPGSHMAAHCTTDVPTQCTPCTEGYFTELWNYLPRCLYCYNFCTGNMEVERECTPVSNRVCRCKEGFFWVDDFCVPHSECEPGYGVLTKGTTKMDTVCEKCPEGHFSNTFSALDTCVKHKECGSEQLVLQGTVDQDTVCGSCENLGNESDMLRTFLDGFFKMHKMRLGKLKRFVTRHINSSNDQRCTRDQCVPSQRAHLLNEVRQWIFKAPVEQLTMIPQMLRHSRMSSLAKNLDSRLREIKENNPDCSIKI